MKTYQEFIQIISESALNPRGPVNPRRNWVQRTQASKNAALRKAGFRKVNSRDLNTNDYSQTSDSPMHTTDVKIYKSQNHYMYDMMPSKHGYGSSSGPRMTPSRERVLFGRRLRRQMGGTRVPRRVHDIAILPDDSFRSYHKNDPQDLVSRGKSFKDELKALPKTLWRIGAKPGEIVSGMPAAVMRGEDLTTGRKKRAKLYQRTFGKKNRSSNRKSNRKISIIAS